MSRLPHLHLVAPLAWLGAGLVVGAPALWLAIGVPLILACALLPSGAGRDEHLRRDDERAIRRQLAVVRRRGHEAEILRAQVLGVRAADAAAGLRISDFAVIDADPRGGLDLLVLMDDPTCDRARVEQRLSGLGGRWTFGWARFPQDGATLDALSAACRARPGRAYAAPGPTLTPPLTTTEG